MRRWSICHGNSTAWCRRSSWEVFQPCYSFIFNFFFLTILRWNTHYLQYEKNTDISSEEGGHLSIFENGINCESTRMSSSPSKNMHLQPTEGAKNLIMDSSFTTRWVFIEPNLLVIHDLQAQKKTKSVKLWILNYCATRSNSDLGDGIKKLFNLQNVEVESLADKMLPAFLYWRWSFTPSQT